jgi:hypothetical protein
MSEWHLVTAVIIGLFAGGLLFYVDTSTRELSPHSSGMYRVVR